MTRNQLKVDIKKQFNKWAYFLIPFYLYTRVCVSTLILFAFNKETFNKNNSYYHQKLAVLSNFESELKSRCIFMKYTWISFYIIEAEFMFLWTIISKLITCPFHLRWFYHTFLCFGYFGETYFRYMCGPTHLLNYM